jgi:hypothetical protein
MNGARDSSQNGCAYFHKSPTREFGVRDTQKRACGPTQAMLIGLIGRRRE